jgi:hypothetical protein
VVGSDHDGIRGRKSSTPFSDLLREILVADVIPALQSHKYGKWIRLYWAGIASAEL